MFKKVTLLVAIVMIFSLVLSACAPATPTAAPVQQEQNQKLKVYGAYATPIQEPWDGVIHAALNKAKADGKIDYSYTENIGYSGDMERVLREICDKQKPDLVVGDAFGNEEAIRRVAKDYPAIAFAFGSGNGPTDPNVAVFDNWIHEPAYLLGMLAAGLSKSGTIGVVAAMPIPEVNRIVNAFIAGAKEINPKSKVLVSFINSFFDPAAAKEAAIAQIDGGADVLFAERFGVIEAAKEKGLWAFGNMSDQNELAPDQVVSSAVWNMDPTINYLITQVKAKTFTAQDLKDFSMMGKGGASLASFHNTESKIPADLLAKVKAKESAIQSGAFRVDINEGAPQPVN